MGIADRIREVMDARGLTVEAFAREIGDKPQRVKDVLRGKQRVPEDMLASLARMRIDVAYLLTGIPSAGHAKLAAIGQASDLMQKAGVPKALGAELMPALIDALERASELPPAEQALVEAFRRCSEADRQVLQQMADRFSEAATETGRKPAPGVAQTFNDKVGQVAGRDIVNKGKRK